MPENESSTSDFDWDVTTFEGARREQLRRWAQLPLEDMIRAIEEMHVIADELAASGGSSEESAPAATVRKQSSE